MKKNLVKILAIASIALVAGACRGKKKSEDPYKEVVINELFELEADGKFKLEGQLVRLKNQCIYGSYGTTYVAGVDYDSAEDARDYKGFELELSAHPDWKGETKGRYANVDVTGKLVNVNGRPVLQEGAVETIHAEAQYDADGNRVDNDGAFSAGLWGSLTRGAYNSYFDRGNSGALLRGTFQIASLPSGAVAGDAASEFYVTFPGENLDVNDEDNDSLIPVTFPKGLNEAAVTAANKFLEGKKVGDFIYAYAISYYDSEKGGSCFMLENWWTKYAAAATADQIPDIFASWAEVSKEIETYYDSDVMDLSGATIDDDSDPVTPEVPDPADKLNAPFSYLIDDSYVTKNPRDLWTDAYKDKLVKVSEPEKCATVEIDVNFKAKDKKAYYDAIKAKVTAATYMDSHPFVADETAWASEGYAIFTQTIGEKVVRELLVLDEGSAQSYALYYTALKAELSFANFAGFKGALESRASEKLSALSGAATTHTSALVDFPEANRPSEYVFSWMGETKGDPYYDTDGAFVYYNGTFKFASVDAARAAIAAYTTALKAAGFEYKKEVQWSMTGVGLYNSTSNEFIKLLLDDDGKQYLPQVKANIVIVDDKYETAFIQAIPASDAELKAAITSDFAWIHSQIADFSAGTSLPDNLSLEGNAVTIRYNDFSYSTYASGYVYEEVTIEYTNALSDADKAAFVAKLTGAGFVSAVLGGQIQGLWNATTCEFAQIAASGNTIELVIYKIRNAAVSSLIQVA